MFLNHFNSKSAEVYRIGLVHRNQKLRLMNKLLLLFSLCILINIGTATGQEVEIDETDEGLNLQYVFRSGFSRVVDRQSRLHLYGEIGYKRLVSYNRGVSVTLFANNIGSLGGTSISSGCGIKFAMRQYLSKKVYVESGFGWAAIRNNNNRALGFIDLSLMYDDNLGVYVMYNPVIGADRLNGNYINIGLQASGKTLGYAGLVAGGATVIMGIVYVIVTPR